MSAFTFVSGILRYIRALEQFLKLPKNRSETAGFGKGQRTSAASVRTEPAISFAPVAARADPTLLESSSMCVNTGVLCQKCQRMNNLWTFWWSVTVHSGGDEAIAGQSHCPGLVKRRTVLGLVNLQAANNSASACWAPRIKVEAFHKLTPKFNLKLCSQTRRKTSLRGRGCLRMAGIRRPSEIDTGHVPEMPPGQDP